MRNSSRTDKTLVSRTLPVGDIVSIVRKQYCVEEKKIKGDWGNEKLQIHKDYSWRRNKVCLWARLNQDKHVRSAIEDDEFPSKRHNIKVRSVQIRPGRISQIQHGGRWVSSTFEIT